MSNAITVYKCDHNGEVVWQYKGGIVDRGETWVCLVALFEPHESDLGAVVFRHGDIFTEWFYSDRWYNIFRVEDGQTGALKGWYCNITRPAEIGEDYVKADDLALDVYVMPNGGILLMDEEEFAALNLPMDERMAALFAVETIRKSAGERLEPFNEIRTGNTDRLR